MDYEGVLTKMQTEYENPVKYYLVFENDFLNINQIIQRTLVVEFIGYQCLSCGKQKKIFRQGFCYDCFYANPQAGDWIMKPELSTAHLDIADRNLEYEKTVQLQPHIVYLAFSSEIKVGVTRKTQIPTRWIDQGATKALVLVEVPNRYLAGITEVALKSHFADKTNWRKMLSNDVLTTNFVAEKAMAKNYIPTEVMKYWNENSHKIYEIIYPILNYPAKINSLNLEKTSYFKGKLIGVKGQYLIFEDGTVFNVRGHEGFKVRLKF